MRLTTLFIPLLLASAAFPQSPAEDFYYILSPREADSGQSVTFEAREYNGCLYRYDVTYELLPTPISSKRTWDVNMIAKRRPECLTLTGYSGPKVVFDSLPWGVYRLLFDSSSDFRRDLGDTNSFEILQPSASIAGKERGGPSRDPGREAVNRTFFRWLEKERRVDGRLEPRPPSAP